MKEGLFQAFLYYLRGNPDLPDKERETCNAVIRKLERAGDCKR